MPIKEVTGILKEITGTLGLNINLLSHLTDSVLSLQDLCHELV